jgi:hypothetical protein
VRAFNDMGSNMCQALAGGGGGGAEEVESAARAATAPPPPPSSAAKRAAAAAKVGQCRLTVSNPALKVPLGSALEATI